MAADNELRVWVILPKILKRYLISKDGGVAAANLSF
jgi:hypothetical protein